MASTTKLSELDDQLKRAEDILLGALGFGETARIIEIQKVGDGFTGLVQWEDGEKIEIANDETLSDLEIWALERLTQKA